MKTTKIYLGLVLLSMVAWSCTSEGDLASSKSLKTSINASAQSLTTAMNTITSSAGYKLLSSSGNMSGSMGVLGNFQPFDTTSVTFGLADVAGVWDYKAALNYRKHYLSLNKFFQKSTTETSTDFILRLPESKIKNPMDLLFYSPKDTTLTNNYVVDVSKYNRWFQQYRPGSYWFDYEMSSNIKISNTNVGDLAIVTSNHEASGYKFVSSFAFANGYDASTTYTTGDTITSIYNIAKAGQTLYQEKYTAVKTSSTSRYREKQYDLTIGNVEIVRNAGPNSLDSAKVYVSGVLQTKSKVEIVTVTTTTADESTITKKTRTIQITFDDGTTTTIKDLLGSTIDDIGSVFSTIREAYFATDIVDKVSYYIYKNK